MMKSMPYLLIDRTLKMETNHIGTSLSATGINLFLLFFGHQLSKKYIRYLIDMDIDTAVIEKVSSSKMR